MCIHVGTCLHIHLRVDLGIVVKCSAPTGHGFVGYTPGVVPLFF